MRRLLPLLAFAACAALTLPGCQTAQDKPGSAFVAPHGRRGALVHRDSSFSFPATLAGFHRVRHVQYEPTGQDISVDYRHDDPAVSAAVFLYPRHGQSAEQEFDRRVAEVGARHKGARAVASGPVEVTPGKAKAQSAEFRYDGPFGGQTQTLRSRLIVAEAGQWFVVYRFSYPAKEKAAAEGLTDALAREFVWP